MRPWPWQLRAPMSRPWTRTRTSFDSSPSSWRPPGRLTRRRRTAGSRSGRDPAAPATYREHVRDALAAQDVTYWDARIGILATGLHEHAGVGRPFLRLGRLARIVRPGLAKAIETVPDPAAQADWWRRYVRPRLFGSLTHLAFARTRILAPLAPEPDRTERMRKGDGPTALLTGSTRSSRRCSYAATRGGGRPSRAGRPTSATGRPGWTAADRFPGDRRSPAGAGPRRARSRPGRAPGRVPRGCLRVERPGLARHPGNRVARRC